MPLKINTQGIGSYPEPPQGVHLTIRLIPNHPPLKRPCFFKASSEYCEQVGWNLQFDGNNGDSRI